MYGSSRIFSAQVIFRRIRLRVIENPVEVVECKVEGSESIVQGAGLRVQASVSRAQGSGRVQGAGFLNHSPRCRV